MMKKEVFERLVRFYNDKAFTHNYIFGFMFSGYIYRIELDGSTMAQYLTLDKASRGAGYALRFKPTVDTKLELVKAGAEVLCSAEYFNEIATDSRYNKGEIFEMLETENAGQTWEKDNIPFWKDGDLTINGKAFQIKFEKATFINEKQMFKMSAEM